MIKPLGVWQDRVCVGVLRIDQHGDLAFDYDADWLADLRRPAVSAALPKRVEPFGRRRPPNPPRRARNA